MQSHKACISSSLLLSAPCSTLKGGIEGIEVFTVQMLLGAPEGVTNLTISNRCHFRLVA